jgi:hypothetical protein
MRLLVVLLLATLVPIGASRAAPPSEIHLRMVATQTDSWLAYAARELSLTEAQRPAFEAYAAAVRAQAQTVASLPEGGNVQTAEQAAPAAQALGDMVAGLKRRLAALEAVQQAAAKLAAELGPEQRIVFDFLALTPNGTGNAGAL